MPSGRGFAFFPPFIRFLLFANVGIFLLTSMFLLGMTVGGIPLDEVIIRWFALLPLDNGFMPWQLITYQFLHGGFMHLFFNMFALWMFGMELENIWGTKRFAIYYLLCGVVAGLVHLFVSPMLKPVLGPTVGASGSIFGVLLAFGMTFPDRPIMMFPIFFPIPARYFVMIYAGIELFVGISNTSDNVAHFAHLGGALGGFLLLKFGEPLMSFLERIGGKSKGPRSKRREPELVEVEYRDVPSYRPSPPPAQPQAPKRTTITPTRFQIDGEPITQEQIDEILDKISQFGYHNLSEREKRILFEVSKQL